MTHKKNEYDTLRGENWAGVYADVPEAVDVGVKLAFVRIRRREQRRKNMVRGLAFAACAALAVGVCALVIDGRQTPDVPDNVAALPVEKLVLAQTDTVYASMADAHFHVYADCPHAGETAVALQLMTALEFEKEICGVCGVNAVIEP